MKQEYQSVNFTAQITDDAAWDQREADIREAKDKLIGLADTI
jgi:hypothetical protein